MEGVVDDTWQVWCLADIAKEWIRMPDTYVIGTRRKQLIGTLPANIISTIN